MEVTKPKPRFPSGVKPDSHTLTAGRYGTYEMCQICGPERTMDLQLLVQGQAALTLSKLHPEIIPYEHAGEIVTAASIAVVDPKRIRELEAETGHDIIAVNTALEEKVSKEAGAHINKGKTSADTTQPARALQLKNSLSVIAESAENLRDIVIEKAVVWIDKPHMDTSHLYDALPTVSGRPFAHYAEMLQSGLDFLAYVESHSVVGKWADATGNHHSATALGINGMKLQQEYCQELGVGHMVAPAQVPGLEFEADVMYVLHRLMATVDNLARYVAWGRSDDVNIFVNTNPRRKKGTSAMPHKDAKNGNPTAEEQDMSFENLSLGNLVTGCANIEMPYARNLAGSASARINLEDGFKTADHGIRRLANVVYWLGLQEERARERVERSYGVVTSQQVMTYLTDHRRVSNPMTRSEAHDLMGKLATKAWQEKTPFVDVLLTSDAVTSRLDADTIRTITNPLQYVGQSKNIILAVKEKCYQKKTLA